MSVMNAKSGFIVIVGLYSLVLRSSASHDQDNTPSPETYPPNLKDAKNNCPAGTWGKNCKNGTSAGCAIGRVVDTQDFHIECGRWQWAWVTCHRNATKPQSRLRYSAHKFARLQRASPLDSRLRRLRLRVLRREGRLPVLPAGLHLRGRVLPAG